MAACPWALTHEDGRAEVRAKVCHRLRPAAAGSAFAPDARLAARDCAVPHDASLGQSFPTYQRLFAGGSQYVDADQQALAQLPVAGALIQGVVPGFLRPGDALILYELAYFAVGDVLELGSFRGLSTTILCQAVANAGRGARVWSVERWPEHVAATRHVVEELGLAPHFRALPGEAAAMTEWLVMAGHTFSVVFVDHDHTYDAVRHTCASIDYLLRPRGVAVFHDLNDERNRLEPDAYGVHRAVAELIGSSRMAYLGTVGCCGLVGRPAS